MLNDADQFVINSTIKYIDHAARKTNSEVEYIRLMNSHVASVGPTCWDRVLPHIFKRVHDDVKEVFKNTKISNEDKLNIAFVTLQISKDQQPALLKRVSELK